MTLVDESLLGGVIKITPNKELAKELGKPIIKTIWKMKSAFILYWQYIGCWFSWYAIIRKIKKKTPLFFMRSS